MTKPRGRFNGAIDATGRRRHKNWRGKATTGNGYVTIDAPDHPHADSRGRVLEHVLVASKALGKPLPDGAVVHHRDDDTTNNDPSNLVICQDQAYHMLLHARRDAYRATGNPDARRCWYCKDWGVKQPGVFYVSRTSGGTPVAWHNVCRAAFDRARRRKAKGNK